MAGNAKPKWYVVLKGYKPGIYTTWDDAKQQTMGFPGPVFKSFETQAAAMEAWTKKRFPSQPVSGQAQSRKSLPRPTGSYVVVDAACSGTPGPTEYQGFYFPDKKPLFHQHIGLANNNIGEFLAIVHALAFLYKSESPLPIYSDSVTAMSWVKNKKVKSELPRIAETKHAWELVDRALVWLNTHMFTTRIWKWETELWGENPADFGRK